MRGIKRPAPTEFDVVSFYEKDPAKILRVKIAMLDAYDALVEQDSLDPNRRRDRRKYPTQPSLSRVLAIMPFWVNEKLACEIRRQLILDKELPEPKNDPKKTKKKKASDRKERTLAFRVPFKSLKDQVENNKQVIAIQNEINSRDKIKAVEIFDKMSSVEVCRWAKKKYAAAWASISRIRTEGHKPRPDAHTLMRMTKNFGARRDESFGD